jgi:integrase
MALRGSYTQQAWALMTRGGMLQTGTSKGLEREAIKTDLASENKSATSQEIASRSVLHSPDSARQYASTWAQCGEYAKETFGVKSLEKLTGEHVAAYLDFKHELGQAKDTLDNQAAHLGKLAAALEKWNGQSYDSIRQGVECMRPTIAEAPEKALTDRAYYDPRTVVSALPAGDIGLAGRILYESGVRISEGTKIGADQLRGLAIDKHTGKEVGRFDYVGKGGKDGIGTTTVATYRELEKAIAANGGKFEVSQAAFRDALKAAAGSEYDGRSAHGLRYNHAQGRMTELQTHGMSRDQAKAVVSKEMNHERPEITELYTAGK